MSHHFWTDADTRWIHANGQAAVAVSRAGVDFAMLTVLAASEGIYRVLWLMNPTKLAAIAP
jgi:RNA polymerase sigma-70 factor (ECF subfamily)